MITRRHEQLTHRYALGDTPATSERVPKLHEQALPCRVMGKVRITPRGDRLAGGELVPGLPAGSDAVAVALAESVAAPPDRR